MRSRDRGIGIRGNGRGEIRRRLAREEEGGLWPWGRWEVVKNVDAGGEGKGVRGGGGEVEQFSGGGG